MLDITFHEEEGVPIIFNSIYEQNFQATKLALWTIFCFMQPYMNFVYSSIRYCVRLYNLTHKYI